jgi:DNA-binding MarR family transcriptional regulator
MEIAERTSFPQSKVSACVARLRGAGAIDATPDPGDRRRLLLRSAETVSERVAEVRSTSVDTALTAALDGDDPQRLAEVLAALETLARHLSPQAISRLRG